LDHREANVATVIGDGGNNTLTGTADDDTLVGRGGDFRALAGNARGGADVLRGGTGATSSAATPRRCAAAPWAAPT
jgi:hypothetical protein